MKTKVNVPKSNPSSLPETTLPETNVSVARLLQIYELQTSPSGKWSPFSQDKLNVVGESHPESNARREQEQLFSAEASGSKNYFQEHEVFFSKINGRGAEGDSTELRLIHDILTLKGLIVGPKWKEYAVAFAARIADALN
ncbi:hypothetical protein LJB80_01105, partial [Bacteroides sp. OttesenSCG-928-F21]|nr:hypothetical protein [Bacteroides sp. OttesenSCG-928-F21]